MTTTWTLTRIGDVLRKSNEIFQPNGSKEYREITVRLWGKGVVERRRIDGASLSGRRFVARQGQFIASRIDARNGAMGLVPSSLDGALVTNDFPLFDIDDDHLLPEFLGWLCRTPKFVELCLRASEGTTNRVRLREDRFLALEIHLPPLTEQHRIVERMEALNDRVTEARFLRVQAVEEAEAFVVSVHSKLAGERERTLGQIMRLDEDATPVAATVLYPQVGLRSFGAGLFTKGSVTGTETTYKRFNRLYEGAIVLSQVKGWEGAVAVCPKDLEGWYVSPEYRTFRCVPSEAQPNYLTSLIRNEWFWSRLKDATRGVGARRERTRPEQFLAIKITMPSPKQQARGELLFAKVDALKRLQTETAAEIDALLPSVLDRALKGDF